MPRMELRVVCGTGDTIDTFSPAAVFKNVDLPAEGRPMIVTIAFFAVFDSFIVVQCIIKHSYCIETVFLLYLV